MCPKIYLFSVLASLLLTHVSSQWVCVSDADCDRYVPSSVCSNGACMCAPGKDLVGGVCADIAPYHTSPCVADSQCYRLFFGFECSIGYNESEGTCRCQPGFHYFHGRCWQNTELGDPCATDEECQITISDPYSMACNGTCVCAEGYYLRQRDECRKIGFAIGDSCIVNEDCHFENSTCNIRTQQCELYGDEEIEETNTTNIATKFKSNMAADFTFADSLSNPSRSGFQYGDICSTDENCASGFICSGICICPNGYYSTEENNTICYAELGMPSTPEQCVGQLAEVVDGICVCPTNFFYADNMRDCVKPSRVLSDSCMSDESCHTFGAAASCGAPEGPWGLRYCECATEQALWDPHRVLCRYFAGVGEQCEVDSDCVAGELEVNCVLDDSGQGYCACPEGLTVFEGLCVTSGLVLGDACQTSIECETANSECSGGTCSCTEGYMAQNGVCSPIIGGVCTADSDCLVANTVCVNTSESVMTCQCNESYVAYEQECWRVSSGYNATCEVDGQCVLNVGVNSACVDGVCDCKASYHYRDDSCWPMTGLFETCSRSSECFLSDHTDRVVCRNSLCQCDFTYPYSEELNDCLSDSSSTAIYGSFTTIMAALLYLLIR